MIMKTKISDMTTITQNAINVEEVGSKISTSLNIYTYI